MNKYRKFAVCVLLLELCLILLGNLIRIRTNTEGKSKKYLVDVSRVAQEMRDGISLNDLDFSKYDSLSDVRIFDPDEVCNEEYRIEDIHGTWYRFCYRHQKSNHDVIILNTLLCVVWTCQAFLLYFLGKKIVMPFGKMEYMTTELAKGNLTVPIKADKSRFFGNFQWGLDLLREKLEHDKLRNMELEKEKKTIVLSLSHDIRTPLSAIDLYAKALAKGLYETEEDKYQAILGIQNNEEKIRSYVEEIAQATREDFMSFEVKQGEFYLSQLMNSLTRYYSEKLGRLRTTFIVDEWTDCLIYGDEDRAVEVGQNLLENAIKYGDGHLIQLKCLEEEGHILISIINSGCGIEEDELAHIFDSFYRGSNSAHVSGSGLGLYISKELLHRMDGEIYAKLLEDKFSVTAVFRKM